NSLLIRAIDANASDVHIEPQQQRLLVRFRINGILHEKESFPKKLSAPLVSRIKVASGMDIAERRRPQDGRMKIKVGVQEVDMRVSSMTVMHGEKVVIRIQKPNAISGGLVKLGLPEFALPSIQKMIHAPNGIVLVTGPTGSGKTTTLYSCLREINTSERNISTIEDPVEYPLAGINQTQVSPKAGLTFASCLRSLLRQDPDVILVGEIRDQETLEAAIHAALTGHLVFSTIHTNNAAKTIARLLEMGAPSYLITSSVIGIVAQRLVRTLCSHCRVAYTPDEQELAIFGALPKNFAGSELVFYKGEGCENCDHSGYAGRVGLYELMSMTREVIDLIDRNASALAIQDEAIHQGMKTLCMDGKEKILSGITSLEEVTRVLGMDLSI
ncbi:MAG: GspE/PulE family protein, partial [Vampirovibrionales bacterium]|nr:GspE/PulE family protein [Vampirovibrionales bacterium]